MTINGHTEAVFDQPATGLVQWRFCTPICICVKTLVQNTEKIRLKDDLEIKTTSLLRPHIRRPASSFTFQFDN